MDTLINVNKIFKIMTQKIDSNLIFKRSRSLSRISQNNRSVILIDRKCLSANRGKIFLWQLNLSLILILNNCLYLFINIQKIWENNLF